MNQPDPNAEICVVGGGLTGMMMAIALAHTPYQVRLLDRSTGTNPPADGRTTTINLASQKMLAALGVWDHLRNAPTPIYAIHVASGIASGTASGIASNNVREGRTLQARRRNGFDLIWDTRKSANSDFAEPEPMGFVVDNSDLFAALKTTLEGIKKPRNITHLTGISVSGMSTGDGRAIVSLGPDHAPIACDLVIACDGANSQLRRGANLRQITESRLPGHKEQTAIVALINAERPHNNAAYQRFLPDGPIALMPLDGTMLSLVWTNGAGAADDLLAMSEDEFNKSCSAAFGNALGSLTLAGDRLKWPLAPAITPQMTRPHLVLAGDSAHAIHPLAGQGYNLALGDAAVLVDALAQAHARGLSAGHSSILVDYAAGRRGEIAAMSSLTSGLNLMLSQQSGGVTSLLSMGMKMLNATGLKSVFVKIARGGVLTKASLLDGNLPKY